MNSIPSIRTSAGSLNLAGLGWYSPAGFVFGILVFLTMRLVVVPLSAVKSGPMKISSSIVELCSHMLLVAIPIAYAASRAARRLR